MKMSELYNRLVRVPVVLDEVVAEINRLSEYIRYPKEPIPNKPFVLIFIQAVKVIKDDDGHMFKSKDPVTLAMSAYAPHTFSFQPDIPIANLQIAVICDVSKVMVRQIVIANQHVCPGIESAPLAYFEHIITPANKILIETIVR